MQARITNPAMHVPGAIEALMALSASAENPAIPAVLRELIHLRASQINGCGVCIELHGTALKKAGESDERVFAVAAWRDAPYFTPGERAALALTEAVTRMSDRPDPVPDEIWDEAARHYDESALAALVLDIAAINVWNRLNVATRQVTGAWTRQQARAQAGVS